ncbi:hypothetical protein Pla110_17330 [Polystyrenella longa]|uniref:Bacterial extracellular solute-binding protein n=1 Tax=Polystyrenella longa TaxID=2528007 RepID=A0A518CLB2_9PLAN|nr:hypothetical protein Pla110_17330 [Polystyrenella longa]
MKTRTTETKVETTGNNSVTRRTFLKAGCAGTAGWLISPPVVHASRKDFTLRVLGTNMTLQEKIRRQAEKDLGFKIAFEAKGSSGVLQKASTRPESFDVCEQAANSINVLWQANAIQPLDKHRIRRWKEISPLCKTGRLTPEMNIGAGDAPHKSLYVQNDGLLGTQETDQVSALPHVHNVDSFGYNTNIITNDESSGNESWGWLFDERYRGRVGLVNNPAIGLLDAALAAQAQGLLQFKDIGNLTRNEIDNLIELMVDYKRRGQFNGIWNSISQSVSFMKTGRVVIESMFSPAVSTLNGMGIPVRYAAPREGYRGWHGVLCLSSKTNEYVRDAAYDYMNWWLEGWAGAHMARQGYYMSIPELIREHVRPVEWNYWYEGQVATQDLPGADGRTAVLKGDRRSGGSYYDRLSNVAVWNTVMDSYEYSLIRWYEFLTA